MVEGRSRLKRESVCLRKIPWVAVGAVVEMEGYILEVEESNVLKVVEK